MNTKLHWLYLVPSIYESHPSGGLINNIEMSLRLRQSQQLCFDQLWRQRGVTDSALGATAVIAIPVAFPIPVHVADNLQHVLVRLG